MRFVPLNVGALVDVLEAIRPDYEDDKVAVHCPITIDGKEYFLSLSTPVAHASVMARSRIDPRMGG